MKPLILILLLSNCVLLDAQTSDQFSDGDFSQNPSWVGDDSLFQVNASHQLQSKGTIAKDICLSTPSSVISGEWHFWCRFNLSPSASNFMRVYLMSDSSNLKGSLNGYYVQLGGVTGSTDSITLYKQKGNIRYRIIGGRPGTVSKTNNLVRIKVLRDTNGNWQLFSDTSGGSNFALEGNGFDTEFSSTQSLGVFVKFTASNAQQYYLDDIYAGPEIVDNAPPRLDSVQVVSKTELRLVFDENVETNSALNIQHYTIYNGIGNPLSAQFETGRSDVVLLTLSTPLSNNSYQLTATDIADQSGNIAALQQMAFVYNVFNAKPGDIVISEFFPDPTPVIGLPEQEFIELYNNTDTAIQLQGWTISDGTSTVVLPSTVLGEDEFLIVCANANFPSFAQYGNAVGLTTLPSLNNTSDQIILKDNTGKMIHQLSYDLTWYANATKADGGYTIEMKNLKQLCKGKQNFAASDDAKGGTPGAVNSHWSTVSDIIAPIAVAVHAVDSTHLEFVFNEPMDSLSLLNGSFVFTPLYTILDRVVVSDLKDSMNIVLTSSLTANITNQVLVSGATDCSGNPIEPNSSLSFTYHVPDAALQYDVLINEVMADPDPMIGLPDAEYVELYNRSDRLISLADWTFGDLGTSAILPDYLLRPDSFIVITSATNLTKFSTIQNVIGIDHFPNLGNDEDELILKNHNGNIIHYLHYTSEAYKNNLKKNGGWSLELVDEQNPCGNNQNLLASNNKSGGTPGRVNSVKGSRKDQSVPKLVNAYPLNAHAVELRFTESLDSTTQIDVGVFTVNNGFGNPQKVVFQPPSFQKVMLVYNDSFVQGKQYRIIVSATSDCAGNKIGSDDYADFGLPQHIEKTDLVINELLFDPKGDGSDFVEVYNRSEHIIDLKNIYMANADEAGAIKDFYPVDSNGLLLFPGSYLVLTDNPSNIQSTYIVRDPKQLIQCKMPSYSNTEGTCLLIDLNGNRYDELMYSDKMHFGLLDNKDGVSLERIDFNRPTSDKSNWTSASFSSGYATPTFQNSQFTSTQSTADLTAEPEVFSPDGDGFNDLVHFSYNLGQAGYTGSMRIYNSSGLLQKNLLRNELLGTTGVFSWDGITDDGTKAPIGIYLCYFEAFNLTGDIIRKKITTVVGGKL